ncbi:trigger factor [Candidatus Mycoplasma haematobovis]|uniref:Trigger factor n=1 Tax=Candidatus Mycoplasma haematobovis TaxID=432608 RepID=A0A1A9QD06_9MOLU|nr:trigger factor [Candidatus Mycoplasma haematobovis]OAL10357.1 trigger factor [Candidatus Mycoplasma haematobovis]
MKILDSGIEEKYINLTIEADPNCFRNIYLKHFNALSKKLNIPGFRKGHAPLPMVLNYIKSRGYAESEHKHVAHKVIDHEVEHLSGEWEEKIFGKQIDCEVKELDVNKNLLVFSAKFEKVPEVILDNYDQIGTWIEPKSLDNLFWTSPKELPVEKDDVAVVSVLAKDREGKVVDEYSYDYLEIDLTTTKLPNPIVEAILTLEKEPKIIKWNELDLELRLLACVSKREITPELLKELAFPETNNIDQFKNLIKSQWELHNIAGEHRRVLKWILSPKNILEPMPVETLRVESYKVLQLAHKKGNTRLKFEDVLFEHVKNLKISFVLNALAKKENMVLDEEDQSIYFRELEERPSLYGHKSPEEVFALPKEELDAHVLQFKAFRFLQTKLFFSS